MWRPSTLTVSAAVVSKSKCLLVATRRWRVPPAACVTHRSAPVLHPQQIRSWPSFREKLTVLDGHAKHLGRLGGVTAMAVTREEDNKPNKPFTR